MTVSGITDVSCSGSNGLLDAFVTMYKYLSGSAGAQANGITLIANCSGSATNSAGGFNYWNQLNPINNNAWAVFKWSNATVPFYMLMQVTFGPATNPSTLTSCASPSLIQEADSVYYTYGALAISIAAMTDGSSPWNGTTSSLGNDRKGDPVWQTSSFGGPPYLVAFPRSNSVFGNNNGSRHFVGGLMPAYYLQYTGATSAQAIKYHLFTDVNELLFTSTFQAFTPGSYTYCYFGKYEQYSGSFDSTDIITSSFPYCMFKTITSVQSYAGPAMGFGYPYGIPNTSIAGNYNDGGVATTNNSQVFKNELAVATYVADTLSLSTADQLKSLNTCYASGSGVTSYYEEWPIVILSAEHTSSLSMSFGLVGQMNGMIRLVRGIASGDTNTTLTRCVVNNLNNSDLTTTNFLRLSIPWNGTTTPSSNSALGVREGSATF
jgi:hypothetical protein